MIEWLTAALEGRYRILSELGAGGMATVYLADDPKHDRQVAIKVLRPELAAVVGAERFLAEIKTTAHLQHPHILPLFDSGEAGGFLFYVMPYVQGESLRERLDREKQLPVDDALRIAARLASALHHAHEKGIVHRDIKPANILMAGDEPEIADFGIALAVQHAGQGRLTETGLSLGTPYYMSPEQATGDREPDRRSDVYALACVVYEMLTGEPPFQGKTAQAVLARILTERPRPPSAFRPSVPAHVDRALSRALEKLPADRFADAEAFGRALRDPSATTAVFTTGDRAGGTGALPGRTGGLARRVGRWLWPAAAAVLGLAAFLGWRDRPAPPERAVYRLGYPAVTTPVSTLSNSVALSPDGRTLVMAGADSTGGFAIDVKRRDEIEPRRLLGGTQPPAFVVSPDGRDLVVQGGTNLSRISLAGGSALTLSDSATFPLAWPEGGYIYFSNLEAAPVRVPENGGATELLAPAGLGEDEVFIMTDALPGGRGLLGVVGKGDVFSLVPTVLDLDDRSLVRMAGPGSFPRYSETGHVLLHDASGTVYALPFDPRTLEVQGDPVPVLHEVQVLAGAFADYDVSAAGSAVYRRGLGRAGTEMIEVRRDGGVQVLGRELPSNAAGRPSPDGRRVVYEAQVGGNWDVHVADLTTGTSARLTFDGNARYPVWAANGDSVAYYVRSEGGGYELWMEPASGAGQAVRLLETEARVIEVAFTDDPDRIVVRQGDRSRSDASELWLYSRSDPDAARPIAEGPYSVRSPMVSPDARWVAYVSDETGTDQVFVRSVDRPELKTVVSGLGGVEPHWAWSGRELFYREGARLVAVPVRLEPEFAVTGARRVLFEAGAYYSNPNHTSYGVLPGDNGFLFFRQTRDAGVYLIENWGASLPGR